MVHNLKPETYSNTDNAVAIKALKLDVTGRIQTAAKANN